MGNQQIRRYWAWGLGIILLATLPGYVMPLFALVRLDTTVLNVAQQQPEDPTTVLQQLAQVNVIYLGEVHDRAADHQAQLEIIQALHQQRPQIAIGMEMFQRPYQSILDQYLAGQLTEAELRTLSQYDQRWGFDWEFYAPILRFAKAQGLPVIALNTPSEITRKVSRSGLESLTPAEQQLIPPRSDLLVGPEAYRQRLQQFFTDIHQHAGHSFNFEHFFLAQVIWDETMAEQIAKTLQSSPDTLMVVLAGQGHIAYGYGIPDRVARRLQKHRSFQGKFVQRSILLNPDPELRTPTQPRSADYFWDTSAGNK
ncbi:ChaN family lipoprotein [Pantanalinema rosaneae CENA516]|uniref:ChaN family lipoprotein n=1 Tax=Pantanalinema rosaneae TaxID=1620701 RepID=UPI003D6DDCEB